MTAPRAPRRRHRRALIGAAFCAIICAVGAAARPTGPAGAGLNPAGAVTTRTILDCERWLLNEHQISEFVPAARFVNPSYAAHAAAVLGPAPP
ncbi:MAG TPA: hypothetical protein VKW09_05520 [bacterium]|nr:hypothetical protein [bacterium]